MTLSDALRIREYIVRFRHRSLAYQTYYYDKKHLKSSSPECLVDIMRLEDGVDRISQDCKEAKKAMKRVQIVDVRVYMIESKWVVSTNFFSYVITLSLADLDFSGAKKIRLNQSQVL